MDAGVLLGSDYSSEDGEIENVPMGPEEIPNCEGVPRNLWNTQVVVFQSDTGLSVAEGIVHSVNFDLVLGCQGPLGDSLVAVQISKSLDVAHVPKDWKYSLRAWPIGQVYLDGASLRDHEVRAIYNRRQEAAGRRPASSCRSYTSMVQGAMVQTSVKAKEFLTQASINSVSSKICCASNCVQPFPRDKIRTFRERMYCLTTFKFQYHMKLDVHRQVHRDAQGKRVVIVEGIEVCIAAWRHILGVSESTFYRFQGYAATGEQVQSHGNLGRLKPRKHTMQATATLKTVLEKQADHMPHRTHTLSSGEKVVSMVLPATFTWKETIPDVNAVNAVFGLKKVSPSNISKIRKLNFPQFYAKKLGDNFARCSKCDKLQTLRKGALSSSKLKWTLLLDKHLATTRAHQDQYYANRYRSSAYPHECLTIMHDKMDHAKTASPVFNIIFKIMGVLEPPKIKFDFLIPTKLD